MTGHELTMPVQNDSFAEQEPASHWSFMKTADPQFLRHIVIAFILALSGLLVLGGFCLVTFDRLNNLRAQARGEYDQILTLTQTLQLVEDAETGERGFIITGKEIYLRPCENARAALPHAQDHLVAVTSYKNKASAALLITDVNAVLADLDMAIKMRQTIGVGATGPAAITDRTNEEIDMISNRIGWMTLEQQRKFDYVRQEINRLYLRLVVLAFVLAFFEFLLSVGTVLVIMRNRVARLETDGLLASQHGIMQAQRDEFMMANDRLTAASRKFEALFERIPVACIFRDRYGTILEWNQACVKEFGWTREEALKLTIFDTIVPAYRIALVRERMAAAWSGRPLPVMEWPCVTKNGEEIDTIASMIPVLGEDGLPIGTVAAMINISERKEVERLKSEFVSTVSHELRTPLTSIRGALGIVCSGKVGDLSDQARRLCNIANNNTERLVRLINDILDIEKIESGHLVFSLVECSITELVQKAVEAIQGNADQCRVSIDLAHKDMDIRVHADPDRLLQVMHNLLSNAIKFSPAGSKVTVDVVATEGTVVVSIEDRGAGIPADFRPRVFDRFAQADNADTRQNGGTGLGLTISKAIIDLFGGRIWFDPYETGTRFSFQLPQITGRTIDVPSGFYDFSNTSTTAQPGEAI